MTFADYRGRFGLLGACVASAVKGVYRAYLLARYRR